VGNHHLLLPGMLTGRIDESFETISSRKIPLHVSFWRLCGMGKDDGEKPTSRFWLLQHRGPEGVFTKNHDPQGAVLPPTVTLAAHMRQ
jgi:hypothetical protein